MRILILHLSHKDEKTFVNWRDVINALVCVLKTAVSLEQITNETLLKHKLHEFQLKWFPVLSSSGLRLAHRPQTGPYSEFTAEQMASPIEDAIRAIVGETTGRVGT